MSGARSQSVFRPGHGSTESRFRRATPGAMWGLAVADASVPPIAGARGVVVGGAALGSGGTGTAASGQDRSSKGLVRRGRTTLKSRQFKVARVTTRPGSRPR